MELVIEYRIVVMNTTHNKVMQDYTTTSKKDVEKEIEIHNRIQSGLAKAFNINIEVTLYEEDMLLSKSTYYEEEHK